MFLVRGESQGQNFVLSFFVGSSCVSYILCLWQCLQKMCETRTVATCSSIGKLNAMHVRAWAGLEIVKILGPMGPPTGSFMAYILRNFHSWREIDQFKNIIISQLRYICHIYLYI